ncbi:hypothetical protein RN001_014570 [Aquatica leii]|uniref:Uncharacterized protein n=1 Tax=Aquatica leii TaxID=1421715 RepID=A0AAN7P234_9COLE|nr:hypothetical protein RN001_014570 [Aquatica leii]
MVNLIKSIRTGRTSGLKKFEDISNFEQMLNDYDFKEAYVLKISEIGDKDVKDTTYKCVAAGFSKELGICSLIGYRGNYRFKERNLMKLLQGRTFFKKKTTVLEIEHQIEEWFRLSKQRYPRTQKSK